MNHNLATQLRDAGFPQEFEYHGGYYCDQKGYRSPQVSNNVLGIEEDIAYAPTLSELIEACGNEITSLYRADRLPEGRVWVVKCCDKENHVGIGPTPEEAVAHLYLALHSHVAP